VPNDSVIPDTRPATTMQSVAETSSPKTDQQAKIVTFLIKKAAG
jgi:hypothetical protein